MKTGGRHSGVDKSEQRYLAESQLGEVLLSVLKSRHRAIVYHIGRRIYSQLQTKSATLNWHSPPSSGWIEIVSLSQLRSVVGGRFQNLKERWVEAGFPLRAHRGDRKDQALVNSTGWTELANWIGKQGFEASLGTAEDRFLFRIRSLGEEGRLSE